MASTLRSIFSTGKSAVAMSQRSPAPPLSFTTAMKALESEGDPEKIAQLLNYCSKSIRRRRSHLVSLARLTKAGRSDLVDQIIGNQACKNPEDLWIRLVRGDAKLSGNLRMLDLACDAQSCPPTEKSLFAFLSFHLKKKGSIYADKSSIRELLKTLSDRTGVRPTALTHNVVLRAFADRDDIGSVLEWIEEMENVWNVAPTIGSYNILLEAHLKSGNSSGFDAILTEITQKGLQYNAVTCSYWIMRLCETDECVTAKKLLHGMVNAGTSPRLASYIALIDGFRRLRNLDSVREVYNLMSPRSQDTYCILLHAELEAGEYGSALDTCKEMMKRNKKRAPPLEAVQRLVKGLMEEGPLTRLPEAMEVVEKMKRRLKGKDLDYWKEIEAAKFHKTTNPLYFIFLNQLKCTKP